MTLARSVLCIERKGSHPVYPLESRGVFPCVDAGYDAVRAGEASDMEGLPSPTVAYRS